MNVMLRTMPLRRIVGFAAAAPLVVQLAGCSGEAGFVRERDVDYKQVATVERLDVPPDLSQLERQGVGVLPPTSTLGTTTYSSFTAGQQGVTPEAGSAGVLPRPESIRVEHDGASRWLVIHGSPERVWPQVRGFWLQQGFLIEREDPRLGIIETGWAENRADIPKGFVRRMLGKVFDFAYSAPTRDKYRVRLERGEEPNATELFLTHWGVKEVVSGGTGRAGTADTIWEPRPSDPELEAEFLNRLIVYFGLDENEATERLATSPQAPRARLFTDPAGAVVLGVDERYARTWRLTGVALDHLGFVVEERDPQRGIYLVRASEPLKEATEEKGFLAKLAFWRDDEDPAIAEERFLVVLTEDGTSTRVRVSPEQAETPGTAQAADKILTLLEEQLR